jgi:hypothetical protein
MSRDILVRHALFGKVLVDVTVPSLPPKVTRVQLPPEGSAAVAAQTMIGPDESRGLLDAPRTGRSAPKLLRILLRPQFLRPLLMRR